MKWSTTQHVFQPQGNRPWARHSATKPCVLMRNDSTPRVFAGFRDESGVSRLGYVDLDPENPTRVIRVSQEPLLDVGKPGMFDDNGVVPAEVLRHAGRIYLYYEGYQLGVKVKFTSFSGLAVSDDDGDTFQRSNSVPVMDRVESESLIRVVGSVLVESDCWRTWYTAGSTFQQAHGDLRPCYDMRYLSSSTAYDYRRPGRIRLEPRPPFEYRLGRPHVRRLGKDYWMLFLPPTDARAIGWDFLAPTMGKTGPERTHRWESTQPAMSGTVRCRPILFSFRSTREHWSCIMAMTMARRGSASPSCCRNSQRTTGKTSRRAAPDLAALALIAWRAKGLSG